MRHQDHLRDRPERPYVQEHRVARDIEALDGVRRHRHEIAMPQHDRLGRAGGAAAEIQRREIVAVAIRQRSVGRFFQERFVGESRSLADENDRTKQFDIRRQRLDLVGKGRMRHQRADAGALQQCGKLAPREPRVHRHAHEASRHGPVIGLQIFAAVGQQQSDAVALREAEAMHRVAEARDALMETPERPVAEIVYDGRAVGMRMREFCKLGADVHVTTRTGRRGRRPRAAPSWRGLRTRAGTAARPR